MLAAAGFEHALVYRKGYLDHNERATQLRDVLPLVCCPWCAVLCYLLCAAASLEALLARQFSSSRPESLPLLCLNTLFHEQYVHHSDYVNTDVQHALLAVLLAVCCSIFGSLEALLARQFSSSRPGQRNDWQELEGCWVLRPPGD
jgi:ABC-type Fe3+ transport system permease subunit